MEKFGSARAIFPMDHLRSGPDENDPGAMNVCSSKFARARIENVCSHKKKRTFVSSFG